MDTNIPDSIERMYTHRSGIVPALIRAQEEDDTMAQQLHSILDMLDPDGYSEPVIPSVI